MRCRVLQLGKEFGSTEELMGILSSVQATGERGSTSGCSPKGSILLLC